MLQSPANAKKTVVVIDDDSIIRHILRHTLEPEGWTVFDAEDGEIGLALIKEHRPSVVLCDLLMPRTNGYTVCRTIRGDPELATKTRIIVTTGSDFPTDKMMAFESGADDVLVKPISTPALLHSMQKLLASDQPPPAPGSTAFISRQGANANKPATTAQPALVRFWGVRGSIPTPGPGTVRYGGNTTCVEVRTDGEIIILDAGTGIRLLGLKLASEFKGKELNLHLLLTHTHWDHIQGFPFFIPAYNPNHRLTILGFEGARRGLESTLSSQMESPYFPIGMHQMPANIAITELKEMKFNIGKVEVRAEFTNHPGVCVGYRVETSGGSVAFMPDNEPWWRVDDRPDSELSPEERSRMDFVRARDAKIIQFLQGTDLLILDCQYDLEEYKTHVGWGHGCLDAVVQVAMDAKVKRLFLFHYDPGHDDDRVDQFVTRAREIVAAAGSKLIIEGAREGLEVRLDKPVK